MQYQQCVGLDLQFHIFGSLAGKPTRALNPWWKKPSCIIFPTIHHNTSHILPVDTLYIFQTYWKNHGFITRVKRNKFIPAGQQTSHPGGLHCLDSDASRSPRTCHRHPPPVWLYSHGFLKILAIVSAGELENNMHYMRMHNNYTTR